MSRDVPRAQGPAVHRVGFSIAVEAHPRQANRLFVEAGLEPIKGLVFHDLRARAGQDARDQGADASEFLGHTSSSTTKRHSLFAWNNQGAADPVM